MSGPAGVEFPEAVRIGFRKYADFSGRAPRAEFWWWMLFQTLASGALNRSLATIIMIAVPQGTTTDALGQWVLRPGYLFVCAASGLVFLLPTLAVTVRRLHDTNRSGWCSLLGFTPLYWAIFAGFWAGLTSRPMPGMAGAILLVLLALSLLLLLGWVRFLIAIFTRGTAGANRFGADPLAAPA